VARHEAGLPMAGSVDGTQAMTGRPGRRSYALSPARTPPAGGRHLAVSAPHLVALVRAGATFINGKLAKRPGEEAQP
jgi:putative transposase